MEPKTKNRTRSAVIATAHLNALEVELVHTVTGNSTAVWPHSSRVTLQLEKELVDICLRERIARHPR